MALVRLAYRVLRDDYAAECKGLLKDNDINFPESSRASRSK